MRRKGFTLVELLAVLAILGTILVIAVPLVTNILGNVKSNAFASDAKMVIKAINMKRMEVANYDPTTRTKEQLGADLNISIDNYESITVTEAAGVLSVVIVGKNKWAGLTATGTYYAMVVTESGGTPPPASFEETFEYTGDVQTFNVPTTGRYLFEVWGAGGGGANESHKSKGGYARGEIDLVQGQTLYIYVGGEGGVYQTGGWNGGGDGGNTHASHTAHRGYKGGGATDIRIGGQALTDRVIVAGGGGGGAGNGSNSQVRSGGGGGGGGYYGGGGGHGGDTTPARAGAGGTQSAGGLGGGVGSGSVDGSLGQGGFGGNSTSTSTSTTPGNFVGGTGGGLTGHNGLLPVTTTRASSGGGGSSYLGGMIDNIVRGTAVNFSTGNGFVKISYPATGTFACGGTFIDPRDSNAYATVQIGGQCWMAENLRYTDSGNLACLTATWDVNSPFNACRLNGGTGWDRNEVLYQWEAAMNGSTPPGAQGLCPNGWYIPIDDEIKIMEINLDPPLTQLQADATGWRGTNQADQLKGLVPYWCNNVDGCATSGFNFLPVGDRDSASILGSVGGFGYFWSSSPSDHSTAWTRFFYSSNSAVSRSMGFQGNGYSVRCIMAP
jgi:uncharacterized protein (TIGR02145 family)/prepilin-type N-terminal cleavage/methylation domain-containing protein